MNDKGTNRKMTLGALAFLVLAILYGVNAFLLKGDRVYLERFSISSNGDAIPIQIRDAGQTYTIDIYTRRETALTWTLSAPDGSEVQDATELTARKGHRVRRFRPDASGIYTLKVARRAFQGRSQGSGKVEVLINDKRILPELLLFF